jgi:hypothetical protein
MQFAFSNTLCGIGLPDSVELITFLKQLYSFKTKQGNFVLCWNPVERFPISLNKTHDGEISEGRLYFH